MASFDFASLTLRYAQDERESTSWHPFVLSVAPRQRREVEGRKLPPSATEPCHLPPFVLSVAPRQRREVEGRKLPPSATEPSNLPPFVLSVAPRQRREVEGRKLPPSATEPSNLPPFVLSVAPRQRREVEGRKLPPSATEPCHLPPFVLSVAPRPVAPARSPRTQTPSERYEDDEPKSPSVRPERSAAPAARSPRTQIALPSRAISLRSS